VDEAKCQADGVEIARRSSGGGTVLLGPGCLLYSLIMKYEREEALREIASSYRFILGRVVESLEGLLPDLRQEGISDLASHGLKCSGSAQQRKSRGLLHHGTLLYNFPIPQVRHYLKQPIRQPDYRRHRDHEQFLINLPATADQLTGRLFTAWSARGLQMGWPQKQVARLVDDKYSQRAWRERRH
jgi:lipoate-protein ligase A